MSICPTCAWITACSIDPSIPTDESWAPTCYFNISLHICNTNWQYTPGNCYIAHKVFSSEHCTPFTVLSWQDSQR
jgi:hypothetical protein